jgi:oligopeptide/dipeptide ABC transporter ATP-binding protein
MTAFFSASGLSVHYQTPAGSLRAVEDVSFEIGRGETLGIVGESGCGKSTLARAVMKLLAPTSGSMRLDGREIAVLSRQAFREDRSRIQMVFQDPFSSLNPRKRIFRILDEALVVKGLKSGDERRARVITALEAVGLDAGSAEKYPHEFSGGQRQRIGIARALIVEPDLVVCDEAVSALDVSVRAQILNLLMELQERLRVSYLFISHDLEVVEHVSDRVAVMYLGEFVEVAESRSLWSAPRHPYTRSLIDADPANPGFFESRLTGEPPSPLAPPSGCRFHPRCPIAVERCKTERPALREVTAGHFARCHLA